MRIAYVRVSTKEQNTGRQFEALKLYNIDKYYEEKISGKDTNRPELRKMLEYAREGDIIYIESFSRLARSLSDLLDIIRQLQQKGVNIVSLKENIDTSTPAGKLQLHIFGALYEFERETIKERQREGIDLALAEGRAYGRPRMEIDAKFIEVYNTWKSGNIKAVEAMKLLDMKKATFYKKVNEYESTSKVIQ
jgi:DNA invertase Pin-like site-specific DNA recombinase